MFTPFSWNDTNKNWFADLSVNNLIMVSFNTEIKMNTTF
jgi:hypothetical protein